MSREEKAKLLGVPVGDFDKLQAEFAIAFNRLAPAKARTRRSRSKRRSIKPPERGSVQDAASIFGKHPRTVRSMASRGKIPGAAKIEGTWTFNLEALRTFVSSKERELLQDAKHQRVVSGGAKCSGAGFQTGGGDIKWSLRTDDPRVAASRRKVDHARAVAAQRYGDQRRTFAEAMEAWGDTLPTRSAPRP